MTSPDHTRASDRVAEASESIDAEIIVLIQGDEPLITPEMVEMSYQPLLKDDTIFCTNLTRRIDTGPRWLRPVYVSGAYTHDPQ